MYEQTQLSQFDSGTHQCPQRFKFTNFPQSPLSHFDVIQRHKNLRVV